MNRLVYERFGSRNGFVRFLGYWLLSQIGAYRRFPALIPTTDQRIVFVCSGNICRSPLAEVYARSLGRDAESCGLDCTEGHPADPRAQEFARKRGLNLDDHRTVNVRNFEFRDTDLIVLMEPSHITSFQEKIGNAYSLALAGHYCKRPTPYIHDPFNCSSEFFANCEQKIMEGVRRLCG